jgi:hypothetical protein
VRETGCTGKRREGGLNLSAVTRLNDLHLDARI